MTESNGAQVKQEKVAAFQILITWVPATGQVEVGASNGLDDVGKLGMLEAAKVALSEARSEAAKSRIIRPNIQVS